MAVMKCKDLKQVVHTAVGASFKMETAVPSAWLGSYLVAGTPTIVLFEVRTRLAVSSYL